MMKKAKLNLVNQINVIFTLITVVTSVLFIFIFQQTVNNFTKLQADKHFMLYSEELVLSVQHDIDDLYKSTFYSYIIYLVNPNNNALSEVEKNYHFDETYDEYELNNIILDYIENKTVDIYKDIYEIDNLDYIIDIIHTQENNDYVVVTLSNKAYQEVLKQPVINILGIGFVAIIILGNAVILLWSSITVERIKKLEKEVTELTKNEYKSEINIEGTDEIAELAKSIDHMRMEIVNNDRVKQEMLQNVSHDIKTPIAVIKSYAEAIQDEVTDISEIDVIIRQADVLKRKVEQLIDWTKLEYILNNEDLYDVNLGRIIRTVADNHKYVNDLEIILDLDDSTLRGLEESYYSIVNNIVENGLRYAKTKIVITLKNKKLTIFNDGEHIEESFVTGTFKPYEKGYKGQFGLGMTIVQRTTKSFNLSFKIENVENGVNFIIEPVE